MNLKYNLFQNVSERIQKRIESKENTLCGQHS